MQTVNIHDAKTHFSRLVDAASAGEVVVIAKAGRPVAQLTRLDSTARAPHRVGFLAGMADIPDDFDRMLEDDIANSFEGRQPEATE